jgi:hypothetical protein
MERIILSGIGINLSQTSNWNLLYERYAKYITSPINTLNLVKRTRGLITNYTFVAMRRAPVLPVKQYIIIIRIIENWYFPITEELTSRESNVRLIRRISQLTNAIIQTNLNE